MKIELQFLAGLLMSGSTLLFRIQLFGFEQALVSTAMEMGLKTIRAAKNLLPAANVDRN